MKNVLLDPDPASSAGGATPTNAAAAPLTAVTAREHITKLQETLVVAEEIAKLLLLDPHFRNCPFVAAIRGPITTGIERIQHLLTWLEKNPVPPHNS